MCCPEPNPTASGGAQRRAPRPPGLAAAQPLTPARPLATLRHRGFARSALGRPCRSPPQPSPPGPRPTAPLTPARPGRAPGPPPRRAPRAGSRPRRRSGRQTHHGPASPRRLRCLRPSDVELPDSRALARAAPRVPGAREREPPRGMPGCVVGSAWAAPRGAGWEL